MHAAFLRFFLTALAALVVAAVAGWCAGAQVRDVDDARDSSLMSEVIPMAATSLLVPAQCIVFDVDSVSAVLAPFASSIAFLFIGSWMFVAALQKHGQWGGTIQLFTGGLALEADFPNPLGHDHGVQFRIFSAGVHRTPTLRPMPPSRGAMMRNGIWLVMRFLPPLDGRV